MYITERQVPRDIDIESQQDDYSGEKRLHAMKNLAVCNENGRILFISDFYRGSNSRQVYLGADSLRFWRVKCTGRLGMGFLGAEKEYPNVILPYKKTKNRAITPIQKDINKAIGAVRVKVEHAFSGVKRLEIIRNKIRLRTYDTRNQVFKTAVALHNFRIQFRTLKINS